MMLSPSSLRFSLGLVVVLGACQNNTDTEITADALEETAASSTENALDGVPEMGPSPAHFLRLDCSTSTHAGRPAHHHGDSRPPPDGGAPPDGAVRPEGRGPHGGGHRGPRLLWVYDSNGDGTLDDAEAAELEADRLAGCEARVAAILAAYDADGDGALSAEEQAVAQAEIDAQLEALRAQVIAEFDANGDGGLDEAEREAVKEARKAEILAAYDSDGDGALSDTEEAALAEAIRAEIRAGNPPGFHLHVA